MSDFIYRVLELYARYDMQDSLSWSAYGGKVSFFANCNDAFWWATADAEDITPENFAILESSFADCNKALPVIGAIHANELFCSRVRGMRPQGAAYPKESELWPLFDACGPERPTDSKAFGNPKPHPRDQQVPVP